MWKDGEGRGQVIDRRLGGIRLLINDTRKWPWSGDTFKIPREVIFNLKFYALPCYQLSVKSSRGKYIGTVKFSNISLTPPLLRKLLKNMPHQYQSIIQKMGGLGFRIQGSQHSRTVKYQDNWVEDLEKSQSPLEWWSEGARKDGYRGKKDSDGLLVASVHMENDSKKDFKFFWR